MGDLNTSDFASNRHSENIRMGKGEDLKGTHEDYGTSRKRLKINQKINSANGMKTRSKTVSSSSANMDDVHSKDEERKPSRIRFVAGASAKDFACKMCDKFFTFESGLKSHMLSHAKAKTFKCHMCSRKFIHKADLTHHFATHMELKDVIHQYDGSKDTKKKERELRKEGCTSTQTQTEWKTQKVDKDFAQSSSKNQVEQQLDLKVFICETCGQAFKRESELKKHALTHVKAKVFACDLCNMRFAQKKKLIRHMVFHKRRKNFRCTFCNEEFTDMAALKQHAEIHTPLIERKCKFCGKKLASVSELRTHVAVHCNGNRKEKVFRCKVCSSEFSQEAELIKHNMTHCETVNQIRSEAKIFKCHLCEEKFSLKENLKLHMVEHMVKKAYRCRYCDKTFPQNSDLIAHMVAHSWIDGFKCHVCEKRFDRKMDLNRHAVQHTKVKYYRCKVCGKDILWKTNFEKHMEKHANEKYTPKRKFWPWDIYQTVSLSTEVDPLFIGDEDCDVLDKGSAPFRAAKVQPSSSNGAQLDRVADVENYQDNVVFIKCEYDEDIDDFIKEEDSFADEEKRVLTKDKLPAVLDTEISSSSSSSVLNGMELDRPIKTEDEEEDFVYVNCDFDAGDVTLPVKEEVCTW